MRGLIPNAFTMGNLLCGVLGIVFAFNEQLHLSGFMIMLAATLDFFDGFAARLLRVQGELGKQLDSLADAVTFGVLPGIMLFQLITISTEEYFVDFAEREAIWMAVVALVFPVAAVYRLAVFNIDTKQTTGFLGMPTPAAALFVAGIPILLERTYKLNFYPGLPAGIKPVLMKEFYLDPWDSMLLDVLFNPWFYMVTAVLLGGLMISRIPMLSLKFKSLRWRENRARYWLLIGVLGIGLMLWLPYLLVWMRWTFDIKFSAWVKGIPYLDWAVPSLVILWYIVWSLVANLLPKSAPAPPAKPKGVDV